MNKQTNLLDREIPVWARILVGTFFIGCIVFSISLFSPSSDSTDTRPVVVTTEKEEIYQGSLSLAEQKQFHYEYEEAVALATCKSEKAFPNANSSRASYNPDDVMKMVDYGDELKQQYQAEVRTKFGVTEDEAGQIFVKGVSERWATPEWPLVDCV